MTIINPKSIAGVTSITTPSGSDNLFTVHTNNTTERIRINNDGDVIVGSGITVSPDGDIFTTGVTTATTFVGALTGNVTGNASGSSGSCTGNAATATALETARNIGGVSFDGSANIDLPGVNSAGNQNTTGNAATATALENARTIGGTSFDGTANIVPAEATNADTVDSLHASSFIRSDADDSFSGTITANSDATNPVIKIQGAGPNFIQFATDGSGTVDDDSINLVYRTTPNTLGFERSSDDTILFSVDADNAQTNFGGDVSVLDKIMHTGDTNTAIRFPADDTITAETGGSEKLRITSSGNVVIGHTAANAKLHIASGTSTAVGDGVNPAFQIGATTSYRLGIFTTNEQAIIANRNGDDGVAFYTKTGSGGSFGEAIRITSGGQLNIGGDYTQTTYKTQIEATDNNVLRLVNDSDDTNGVELVLYKDSASPADGDGIGGIYFQGNDDGGNSVFYANIEGFASDVSDGTEDGYIRFRTRLNGSIGERVRIISRGDMGVGTQDPQGRLHISSGNSGDCELIIEADEDNNNENDNPRILFRQDGGSDQSSVGTNNNQLVLANSVSSSGGIALKTGTTTGHENATDSLVVESNGNVTISDGDIIMASGHGISFAATSNSGGTMGSEVFHDYEEGTFTPSYTTSNTNIGSVTYDVRTGRYTKIGRMVYITVRLRTDSISDVGSGTIRVTGLPFTHVNATSHRAASHNLYTAGWTPDDSPSIALFVHNQTYFQLYQKDFNNDSNGLDASSFNTGANDNDIRLTAMYETSQ